MSQMIETVVTYPQAWEMCRVGEFDLSHTSLMSAAALTALWELPNKLAPSKKSASESHARQLGKGKKYHQSNIVYIFAAAS